MPAQPGVMVAGLYYTPNLSVVPDPSWPEDELNLAAITPIGLSSELPGVFVGGTVEIPGIPGGSQVLLQVRVWSAGYGSYAECYAGAWAGNWVLVGASNTGILTLGGGTQPTPSTSSFLDPIHILLIPEPSTWLLGFLGLAGAGGLAFLRRRPPSRR